MRFTETLWHDVEEHIFLPITQHPFLKGLCDGTLSREAFQFYVAQDAHYLHAYSRSLALLAARSDTGPELDMFCRHAAGAVAVEQALHTGFFREWGWSADHLDQVAVAPQTLLYTSFVGRTVYDRPYFEGVCAVLPCYWIYWEVGKLLVQQGSPDALYQRWIDTYAGDAFATVVQEILSLTDALTGGVSSRELELGRKHFYTASRCEWMFWDAAYHQQMWPVG